MKGEIVIFWFRRDLRLQDNAGLSRALQADFPVLPIFIFDIGILGRLTNNKDRRVDYIHQALTSINDKLINQNTRLITFHGRPFEIFETLTNEYDIEAVYCNRDYDPEAIKRDKEIYTFLKAKNIPFKAYKDQVIFDKNEVVKKDGHPYTVYTPYKNKWLETLKTNDHQSFECKPTNFLPQKGASIHSLENLGFRETDLVFEFSELDANIIDDYDKYRDYPALQRTTKLGIALRFGTISIRECVAFAIKHNQTWLSQLIWREFFMQILFHFPEVVDHSFKPKYDFIEWRNNTQEFELWCEGKTGFPLVDAGMRQLNQTGYMHNRVRMIAASFLCKDLLIDWRWGEAYFAQKLNDYELSSNNGNWQWAAGSGCDAAPYFRIFNPTTQIKKFDKDLEYIRKWIPEYGTKVYPEPMVNHKEARERALKVYGIAIKDNS